MEIKDHTLVKHRILEKYLKACEKFHNKYENFCYIDTHGGSGIVHYKGRDRSGSPLIAADIHPYPCHVVEIDTSRYACLKESVKGHTHVHTYHGDCNVEITRILSSIPNWKFVFCFIDPDGLVYQGNGGVSCIELHYSTIDKIAAHPKTELLINFPLESLIRCAALVKAQPEDPRTPKIRDNLNLFFGNDGWIDLEVDKRKYLDFFIKERLDRYYQYIGAICVREASRNVPLYYLVYASTHQVGGKIMRSNMKIEWGYSTLGSFEEEFPLNRFIFEPRESLFDYQ